jgi:hypothetical protein
MDKRGHLKPKKQKESNAPHMQRQRASQMQAAAPQQPLAAPASAVQAPPASGPQR